MKLLPEFLTNLFARTRANPSGKRLRPKRHRLIPTGRRQHLFRKDGSTVVRRDGKQVFLIEATHVNLGKHYPYGSARQGYA